MKKMCLFMLIVMLTACGVDGDNEGAGEQAEHAESQYDALRQEAVENEEDPAIIERTYEKENILYSEPKGLAFRKDLEKTKTDYAAYYFEAVISEQERNECIEATDKMLSCIDAPLPVFEVIVLEPKTSYGVAVTANRLFLPPQQWDSVDYLAKVLLAGYGEWGNYGLAYGYADYLHKKAGFNGETNTGGQDANAEIGKTDSDNEEPGIGKGEADRFQAMSTPQLYDLNLLCFDERFSSAEDVEAAKNNACLFVRQYLASHSEEEFLELLSASGTLEGAAGAREVLEEFYAENGVECSLSDIRYQYGGLTLDYAAACEYACFHVARDWQDPFWEQSPLVSENFLHEDYGEVRNFFECSERQMEQYQEIFGFDSYDNSLVVRIDNSNDMTHSGYYLFGEHIACLISARILMHEYIHSLMDGHFVNRAIKWKVEGVAQYFDYKYNIYAQSSLSEYTNNEYIYNEGKEWVQEYIDFIGRPVNAQTDFQDLEDHYTYYYGIENPNFSYDSAASFVGYLVDQYGEQAVIAYVCSDDEYNADWDKSYDELVQDWNQYIEENYSHFSKK